MMLVLVNFLMIALEIGMVADLKQSIKCYVQS